MAQTHDIFNDSEFKALPQEKRASILTNYFNREMVDDEYISLPAEQQSAISDKFVQSHLEAVQAAPEVTTAVPDAQPQGGLSEAPPVQTMSAGIKLRQEQGVQAVQPDTRLSAKDRLKEAWENPSQLVPFLAGGMEIKNMAELSAAAWDIKNNGEKASEESRKIAQSYLEESARRGDTTFGYKVMDVLAMLPSFAGELFATGGIYTAGRNAAVKASRHAINKILKETVMEGAGKTAKIGASRAIGAVAGATAQTLPARGLSVIAETIQRSAPTLQMRPEDAEGLAQVVATDTGEDIMTAMAKSAGSQWVEVVSERSGGAFTALKKGGKELAVKMGLISALKKANPGKTARQIQTMVKRAGWNGVIEEMFEERVGEAMRAGIGLEDYQLPTLEQLAVELVAFSIPGAGIALTRKAAERIDRVAETQPGTVDTGQLPDVPAVPPVEDQAAQPEQEGVQLAPEEAERYNVLLDNLKSLSNEELDEYRQANAEILSAQPGNRDFELLEMAFEQETGRRAALPKTRLGKVLKALSDAAPVQPVVIPQVEPPVTDIQPMETASIDAPQSTISEKAGEVSPEPPISQQPSTGVGPEAKDELPEPVERVEVEVEGENVILEPRYDVAGREKGWDVTPGDNQIAWENMMADVERVRDEVQPQIEQLNQELESIRGGRDKETQQRRNEINNLKNKIKGDPDNQSLKNDLNSLKEELEFHRQAARTDIEEKEGGEVVEGKAGAGLTGAQPVSALAGEEARKAQEQANREFGKETPLSKIRRGGELHLEVEKTYGAGSLEETLVSALNGIEKAVERWGKRRSSGLTDDELTEAISREFGLEGGQSVPGGLSRHRGGKNPVFEYPGVTEGEKKAIRLQGNKLREKVRELMRIPYPEQETEPETKPVTEPVTAEPASEAPETKQSWEMTLLDYGKSRLPASQAEQIKTVDQVKSFRAQHRKDIQAALERGDKVPPEVLAEYPDLAEKSAPPVEAPPEQREPWKMTRAEFYKSQNGPILKKIQDYVDKGNEVRFATQTRITLISKPEHLRMNSVGDIQVVRGKHWDTLTDTQIEQMATDAGFRMPKPEERGHSTLVRDAYEAGKDIPKEVLAEYPQLTRLPLQEYAPGRVQEVFLPDNTKVETEYAVVELGDLIASHTVDFDKNKRYPQEIQPRDRDRKAMRYQVDQMAEKLEPARLMESNTASTGAPIVGPDFVVESGNGRVLALQKAYQGKQGENYRKALAERAASFGLEIGDIGQPVLVRVRTTEVDRVEFAKKANQGEVARMSPAEQAKSDAERMEASDLQLFNPDMSGNLAAASNRPFLARFFGKLGIGETAQFTTAEGTYTKQAIDRVQAALFQKAYEEPELLALTAEEADPEIKHILNALTTAAPEFIRAKSLKADPNIQIIIGHITGAAKLVRHTRNRSTTVKATLNQATLFEPIPQDTASLALFLENSIRSARRMGELFSEIGRDIQERLKMKKNLDMFGYEEVINPSRIIDHAIKKMEESGGREKGEIPGLFGVQENAPQGRVQSKQVEGERAEAGNVSPQVTPTEKPAEPDEGQTAPAKQLISFSKSDLPFDLAERAHRGTSFVPEKRAVQEQQDYYNHLKEFHDSLLADIFPEQYDQAAEELARYKDKYLSKFKDVLASQSRIVSTMIAGPANFPVSRMEKANNAADRKIRDLLEWQEKAQRSIEKRLGLIENTAISSDDADAVEQLQEKIDKAEKYQEMMKGVNAIVRKKNLTTEEKIAKIKEDFGLSETVGKQALEPDYMGRLGFPNYELTNNSANIRRMKKRDEQLKKSRSHKTVEIKGEGGIRLVDNVEDNRVQLFFPDKPDADVRKKLKSNGFKWAPSVGAWQRMRSGAAQRLALEIAGQKGQAAPEDVSFSSRSQTETAEFKAWFSGSKVVDENGEPLVVGHWTQGITPDFSVFDISIGQIGQHFGALKLYDGADLDDGKVYPVFLSIKNPLRLRDHINWGIAEVLHTLRVEGIFTQKDSIEWSKRVARAQLDIRPFESFTNRHYYSIFREMLEDKGYDGIIYLNRREGVDYGVDKKGMDVSEIDKLPDNKYAEIHPEATDSFIVFHPTQIKSATGNIGTFDPTNPDIRFSAAKTAKSAKGATADQVRKWISPIAGKFTTPVEVLDSIEDLPEPVRSAAMNEAKRGNIVLGLYDKKFDNKVYLIADAIRNQREAYRVLFHEKVGHEGIEGLLGDKGFDRLMSDLQKDRVIGKQIRDLQAERGYKSERTAAKEWFAQKAEGQEYTNLKLGVISRLVFYVKKALRRAFGSKFVPFSDADIRELLRQSWKYEQRNHRDERVVNDAVAEPAFSATGDYSAKSPDVNRENISFRTVKIDDLRAQRDELAESLTELPPVRSGLATSNIRARMEQKLVELEERIKQAETYAPAFMTRSPDGARRARLLALFEPTGGRTVQRVSFELPPETRLEYLKRYIQDSMNRLSTVQKQIKKTGKNITPEMNAYQAAVLEVGRAADQVEKFREKMISGENSFAKRLTDAGIDQDAFGEYLMALHTPERRRVMIEKRIEALESKPVKERETQTTMLGVPGSRIEELKAILADKDNTFGSGMSENEANEVKAEMEKKHPDIVDFAEEFYREVSEAALQIRFDAGLLSQEAIDNMRTTYGNYVPLKGIAGEEGQRPGQSRKSGIMTSGIRRAKGRWSRADNPFIQAMVDYTDAIARSEQNRSRQAFLKLVEDNPDSRIWEVEGLKHMPVYDENGEVQYYDPKHKFADNVLEVLVEGKTKVITIKDTPLADGMKNIGMERSFKTLNSINSYLRSVNIMLAPEFLITNFERDLQTALINITGEDSAKLAAQVAKGIPKAMRGIWRNSRQKHADTEMSAAYAEMKTAGGKVSWMDLEATDEMAKRVENELKRYRGRAMMPKRILTDVGRLIENSNEMVEMGVRLSFYKALRDSGVSAADAAQKAKELTVNFNTRGQVGPAINSLYLFANAGIQGSFRMFRALKHKRVQQIVAGLVVMSFVQSLFCRWMDEDEWEQVSDYNKDNHWLFMLPDGKMIAIKVPYGFNIFKVLGNLAEETAFGNLTFAQAAKRLFGAANDAFNPLGGGSFFQFMSPTAFDAFAQLAENKNFFGGPIMKEQAPYQPAKPNFQQHFKGVNIYTRQLTAWLNKLTGGTEKVSGAVDVNPEVLDHLIEFMGGGLGRFIGNSLNLGEALLTKEDTPEIGKVPMVRQFLKEPSEWTDTQTIRDMLNESQRNVISKKERTRFETALRRAREVEALPVKQLDRYEKQFNEYQAEAVASKAGLRSREEIIDEWESYFSLADTARSEKQLELTREAVKAYNKEAAATGQRPITNQLLLNASRRGLESRRKAR